MFEVRQTLIFEKWLDNLSDTRAAKKIAQRIARLRRGLFGDVRPVGEGLSELRVDHGPGYRIYFIQRDRTIILLLCGGSKQTQNTDIKRAKQLAELTEI
jgi:putative addiction module killer protein